MSAASPHRNVAAASLAVTAVLVVVMAVWGFNSLTAPIDDDGFTTTVAAEDDVVTCGAGEEATILKNLTSAEVTVSVYNAGKKAGRATETLNQLEDRGFEAGAIGNAPELSVDFVELHVKETDRLKAQLVALSLGKSAEIVVDNEKDLRGPGVNVVIGDKFRKLKAGAPRKIKRPEPITVCR